MTAEKLKFGDAVIAKGASGKFLRYAFYGVRDVVVQLDRGGRPRPYCCYEVRRISDLEQLAVVHASRDRSDP